MSQRDDLIQALSADLKPVRPVASPDRTALLWLLGSLVWVIGLTAWEGPLRPGALGELMEVPRFLFEMALGLLAFGCIAICAFRAAVPGRLQRGFAILSFVLLGLWLVQYLVAFWAPALEPSMAGKRQACWVETIVYAIGPMLLGLFLTRRLYPLSPWRTALCVGLVTGLLPAWYMQMACMYLMPHMLDHHILPGILVGLAGTGLAFLYKKDRLPG